jgi:hypothetical protein
MNHPPLTPRERQALDNLLDYIYEHGTAAEGVTRLAQQYAAEAAAKAIDAQQAEIDRLREDAEAFRSIVKWKLLVNVNPFYVQAAAGFMADYKVRSPVDMRRATLSVIARVVADASGHQNSAGKL